MNRKTFPLLVFLFTLAFFASKSAAQPLLGPGSPDPTFGTDGRVLTPIQGGCNVGDALLLPDNKIVELCTQERRKGAISYYSFLLVRHDPDGSLDNTFGAGGVKTILVGEGPSSYYYGNTLQLLPDGKIIIAGTLNRDFGMVRVNSDGSLDESFGEGGQVRTEFAEFEELSSDYLKGLTVRPDGKLVAYGKSVVQTPNVPCNPPSCYYNPEFQRLALAQYNADGSPDTSFGTGGIQRSRFTSLDHYPQFVTFEPDGKLLFVAGVSERGADWGLSFTQIIARYNTDGSLDTNFGKDGFKELPNAAFSLLPNGKMLGAEICAQYQPCNYSNTGAFYNTRFSRFNSDLTVDGTFGSNGFVPYYLLYNDYGNLYPQPDGKFIFATFSSPGISGAYSITYLYRFNSDGGVDFSFGSNGAIAFDLDNSNAIASQKPKIITRPDGKILAVAPFYPPQNTSGANGIAIMRFIGRNGKVRF
jgi:uncharacterized delta-60 repeat protein